MTPRETAAGEQRTGPWRPTWSPGSTRPGLPPLSVVHDVGDDYAFMAAALAAHTPARGRITVHPTPVAGAPASLAHDLLRALGKHLPLHGSPEAVAWAAQAEIAWRAAAAWMLALRIGHLVVTRAHRISSRHFEHLFALRELTGMRLTLLCHGPVPAALADVLPTLAPEQVHTLTAARRVLAAAGPEPHTAGHFAWWQATAQFPPHPGEPCFWLPLRRKTSRADLEAASKRLNRTVLPLPAPGRFPPEPDEHTLFLAHRLHARIAHPVHAAALALRILTGRPPSQLPGPTAPPSDSRTPSGRPAQIPAWAAGLLQAAHCFGNLDRMRSEGPLRLSSFDQQLVAEAARACALHEIQAPGTRRSGVRTRPSRTRKSRSTPTRR